MGKIKLILSYKDFFDDIPLTIPEYLKGINKEELVYYARYYCSLSTQHINSTSADIFWAFLNKGDEGTEYYNYLANRVTKLITTKYKKTEITILNIRTSLKFFELVQCIDNINCNEIADIEIRKRLLKVYLLLNDGIKIPQRENPTEIIIANSLVRELYQENNYPQVLLTQIIKSSLFFEYCERQLPVHLRYFLKDFGLEKWQEYINYLYQLAKIHIESEDPVISIFIPKEDSHYKKKTDFINKFCLQESYDKDEDFTNIKNWPIINVDGGYGIIFPLFFYEKIYKGLYFIFRNINTNFQNTEHYINETTFKSDLGLHFSEKVLLNRILKDSLGKKYKHLGAKELTQPGYPDYYIRDGKYIMLFEYKDNLMKKSIIESVNMSVFIAELKEIFLEKSNSSKPKAIKQLINNIKTIENGYFVEDKGIKPSSSIIYPIIVTHNGVFSISGINILINEWFKTELNIQLPQINNKNIKDVTIIDIDTLIIYQGVFSQPKYSLKLLIDEYWANYYKLDKKRNYGSPEEVVADFPQKYQSFKQFVELKLRNINYFTKEILQYSSKITL